MTVNPGFGGQQFIKTMLSKIRQARELIDRFAPAVLLEVDGGVTLTNMPAILKAGADVFVAGASIFGSGNYRDTIGKMKACMSE
jgi:ribulose-phosphate 3-epimerase